MFHLILKKENFCWFILSKNWRLSVLFVDLTGRCELWGRCISLVCFLCLRLSLLFLRFDGAYNSTMFPKSCTKSTRLLFTSSFSFLLLLPSGSRNRTEQRSDTALLLDWIGAREVVGSMSRFVCAMWWSECSLSLRNLLEL